jgi:outer membrane protein assembly factor BamB
MDTCHVLWTNTCGYIESSPVIGDIDGDSKSEVVICLYERSVVAVSGEDGSQVWSYDSVGIMWPSFAAIGDIDSDRAPEVVFTWSEAGFVYALNGEDGSFLWRYFINEWISTSPVLEDIDDDGRLEVIVGCNGLYAINGEDGSLAWRYGTTWFGDAAVGDIDGDGKPEVIGGHLDSLVHAINGEDGSFLWSYATGGPVVFAPTLADVDADSALEVIFGSYDSLVYALNAEDGSYLWSRATGNAVKSSPAVGDIEGDGILEVLLISDSVYALGADDGSRLWASSTQATEYVSPVLGDIDGDSLLEVIIAGDAVYALNGEDGSCLWIHAAAAPPHATPALGDIDGDGEVEMIIASGWYGVQALDSEGTGVEGQPGVKHEMQDVRLFQNSPNPFHSSTLISYSLPSATQVTLAIYDVTGRLVETLVDETQQPGMHQVRWNRNTNPSGVYFSTLKVEESVSTNKMVVVD